MASVVNAVVMIDSTGMNHSYHILFASRYKEIDNASDGYGGYDLPGCAREFELCYLLLQSFILLFHLGHLVFVGRNCSFVVLNKFLVDFDLLFVIRHQTFQTGYVVSKVNHRLFVEVVAAIITLLNYLVLRRWLF